MDLQISVQAQSKPMSETNVQSNGPFLITQDQTVNYPRFKNSAQWSLKEDVKFLIYLNKNADKFRNSSKNQRWAMFKEMARFIKTRNYNQCRSHYIHILRQHSSINAWRRHLHDSNLNFDQFYESYAQDFEVKPESHPEPPEIPPIRTDRTYRTEAERPPVNSQPIAQTPPTMPSNILRIFYPQLEAQRQRQEAFKQCHKLFLEWQQKMRELLELANQP